MPPFIIPPEELWAAIARLADEHDHSWRFTKKGDRRPAYDVEAQRQARKATLAKQRAAADERIETRRKAIADAKRPAPGEDIASRMVRGMAPGAWYGMGDLARLAGTARSGRAKVHQVLRTGGLIERVQNPKWVLSAPKVDPWAVMGGASVEPEWLYRLTAAGEARRRELRGESEAG